MTNKEAKDVLQEQIDRYGQEYDAEGIEALEIAIKVLEQTSCKSDARRWKRRYLDLKQRVIKLEEQQPCEDCISREEVHDLLATWLSDHLTEETREALETINGKIGDMPPVTPKAEPCDDAISRQAVLALAEKGVLVSNGNYQAVCKAINELPPVIPKGETITEFADRCRECGKMRKGHWIYDKTFENWRCSKCNESPKTLGYVGTADFMAEHFKFCNHCGAKMVEPQESESDD